MDKQKLPLQVIRETRELLIEMKQALKNSSLPFDIKVLEDFGFQISSKKHPQFDFAIIRYEIKGEQIKYFTHIESSNLLSQQQGYDVNEGTLEILKHFNSWLQKIIRYDTEYNELAHIDFENLIKLEDEILLQPEENIYEEKDKILPYCLKSLSVANFQGIKHAAIENLPIDTQWVFLVGENGFGKSSVLQSILLGLYGYKDGNLELIQDRSIQIQVVYKSEESNFVNNCWVNSNPLFHIAAYGPSRLNLQVGATISDEARVSSVSYGLFNNDGALLNIESKMKDWLLQNDTERFELAKKAFCDLIPYLSEVRYNESTSQIEYIEKDVVNGSDTYEAMPYNQLATGFRAVIGIVSDMIVRLSHSQPEVKDPAQLKGIVIIDELDLHWHPKFQKQIPQLFSSVFPKVQFIVSTHSSIPLLGAPHNSVILKVTRTKEEGVKIERVDVDLKYLTPNLILTSGIFDMDDVLSVENDDLTKTRTEDSFEEMKHNDEVDDYLAEFEKSNRQFPDELFEPKAN